MIAIGIPGAALRALLVRATVLWILVRLLTSVAGAIAADERRSLDSPFGIILVCCAIGFVDVHRRHERALWANLGISHLAIGGVFASIATIAEGAWFFLRPGQ